VGTRWVGGVLQGMPVHVTLRRVTVSLLAVAAIVASACGASPTQPTAAPASAQQSAAASAWTEGLVSAAATAALTPADLVARGWTCRPIPLAAGVLGTGCSSPNQGFPSPDTPLEDRRAVFTVLAFDPVGAFIGTATLLRADLYHGQQCESTQAPYTFFSFIGYYFCVRTAGA
jgi:hypothetical protein